MVSSLQGLISKTETLQNLGNKFAKAFLDVGCDSTIMRKQGGRGVFYKICFSANIQKVGIVIIVSDTGTVGRCNL